jgi:hypothetical protein
MTPTQNGHRPHEDAPEIPTDRLKAFIETRLARREPPTQIANAVQAYFGIALDGEQIIPFWKGEITLPTQTEHRPDKESVQIPADEPKESLFTRMAGDETSDAMPLVLSVSAMPHPMSEAARGKEPPATQTGHRQDEESMQIPLQPPKAFIGKRLAVTQAPTEIAGAEIILPTQTGHLQNEPDGDPMSTLTDEIKEFIVKALACYDTPSQVAEAVRVEFGVEVGRQQIHAYNPDGSRPPAPRWIALHTATREKFLSEMAEIGIAHKAVRLRMLDRFARRAEANNFGGAAAEYLEQAAKECGGVYENRKRAVPPNPSPLVGEGQGEG